MNINSIFSNIGEAGGFSFKPKYQSKEDEDFVTRFLGGAVEIGLPNLFKQHIDNEAKAYQLRKMEIKTEKQAMKEAPEEKTNE